MYSYVYNGTYLRTDILQVVFVGKDGVDTGGLTREFFG